LGGNSQEKVKDVASIFRLTRRLKNRVTREKIPKRCTKPPKMWELIPFLSAGETARQTDVRRGGVGD